MAKPDEDPWRVGAARAARSEGAFSWRNARMACLGEDPVGVVIDYPLRDVAPPGDDVPALFRPLCELEVEAAGTHYINILAVLPGARRRGVARRLIADCAERSAAPLSLIVASGNAGARAFYAAEAFTERARRPMGRGGPEGLCGDWVLLCR